MNENPRYAAMYKDEFAKEKAHREKDIQRIEDVHERFGYFADEGRMRNKIKDKRFDLPEEIPDTEDEAFTTEFEDSDIAEEDTELYRMYRMMQSRSRLDQEYLDA